MAKITRVYQGLFGVNGDQAHFGQFGSRAAGSPVFTKDPSSIQSLTAFTQNGWLDAINAGNIAPFLEDMNGLMLLIFRQLGYLMQEGIAEWDVSTSYYVGSIVKKTGTFEFYSSAVNDNVGNGLPNQTSNGNWNFVNPPTVAAGLMIPFAGPGAPFGYLPCDGNDYDQGAQAPLFNAIGTTWNNFNGRTTPGGRFRVPDAGSLTLMGAGHGLGFSARALAGLIGEETHLLVTGEIPSHNHALTDPGHAHTQKAGTPGGGDNNFTMNPTGGANQGPTTNSQTGISLAATGGGGAHNNMQPSVGINYVIKT